MHSLFADHRIHQTFTTKDCQHKRRGIDGLAPEQSIESRLSYGINFIECSINVTMGNPFITEETSSIIGVDAKEQFRFTSTTNVIDQPFLT